MAHFPQFAKPACHNLGRALAFRAQQSGRSGRRGAVRRRSRTAITCVDRFVGAGRAASDRRGRDADRADREPGIGQVLSWRAWDGADRARGRRAGDPRQTLPPRRGLRHSRTRRWHRAYRSAWPRTSRCAGLVSGSAPSGAWPRLTHQASIGSVSQEMRYEPVGVQGDGAVQSRGGHRLAAGRGAGSTCSRPRPSRLPRSQAVLVPARAVQTGLGAPNRAGGRVAGRGRAGRLRPQMRLSGRNAGGRVSRDRERGRGGRAKPLGWRSESREIGA
jgi:hypothetical protein